MPGTVRPPSFTEITTVAPAPRSVQRGPAVTGAQEVHVAHAMTSYGASAKSLPDATMAKVCPTCGVHYPAEFKVCPRDATELTESIEDADRDELVGKTLSQTYTILRVIGEGGMGRVYEARHTRIGSKRFAIKILHPEFARQPEVISRFQREAEAAAAIKSPYVVDVYDVDRSADGRPFLVGEFLEGQEFATYLEENGKMSVGSAVRIVRHICKALISAHAKGVIHRDMKPENVFLTGHLTRPTAKVIDFGISKIGDAPGTALTKTGMILGTPSYMAPEQARGERVDHRADIYAVGAILYCALTGQRPFDRDDPTATLTAVLTQDPPSPRSIEPSIPEPLEMVIQKAMAKLPQDRFQSMAEFDAELAAYEPAEEDDTLVAPASLLDGGFPTGRTSAFVDPKARMVRMARPMILLLGGLGLFWSAGILMTMVTGIVRILRGSGPTANLTGSEAIFLVSGLALGMLTPLILAVRHLIRKVWDNSVKAVDLSERLHRPIVVGLCAYGFASLLVRVIESVVLRHAVAVAWPIWDLILFAVGALAALIAFWLHAVERRERRA
jgi:hypothetical protein